jgi:hypothetical protein
LTECQLLCTVISDNKSLHLQAEGQAYGSHDTH